MSDSTTNNNHPVTGTEPKQPQQRRRSNLPLIIVAALFVVVPFLTWYGTWFGRQLSDAEIEEYLSDEKKPRRIQHALSQIEERMVRHDQSARRWYPRIQTLAANPVTEFRKTAAYLMGFDNSSEEFHATLLHLLEDGQPSVRRQAALSLVTFGDTRGRAELRAMLEPYTVQAPAEGTLGSVLSTGSIVREGSLMARIEPPSGGVDVQEVRSPLPGRVGEVLKQEGARVGTGEALFIITPDGQFVWEALRALYLVGEREDLPAVERYASGAGGRVTDQLKQQAAQTARAIQSRMEGAGRQQNSRRAPQ
ncbi:MAG TPA: hypothetical protein VGX92_22175 [Pyrinomonadaceae bacterium]|jgi:acetyl/propionyl-CoA carboxylase alpha subunit|nr:hypothetical protein [Pyrinomonadaceae bacterium]